jgi:hypothetical protein
MLTPMPQIKAKVKVNPTIRFISNQQWALMLNNDVDDMVTLPLCCVLSGVLKVFFL